MCAFVSLAMPVHMIMAIIQRQLLLNQLIVEQENANVVAWVSVTILSLPPSVTAFQARMRVPCRTSLVPVRILGQHMHSSNCDVNCIV